MRKNEYVSIHDFLKQYVGEWNPSEGQYLGLDFLWQGSEYRFQTDSMYNAVNTILPDGREARFGLYRKVNRKPTAQYKLIAEYASVTDALTCIIDGKPFGEIIIHPDTELLGQD